MKTPLVNQTATIVPSTMPIHRCVRYSTRFQLRGGSVLRAGEQLAVTGVMVAIVHPFDSPAHRVGHRIAYPRSPGLSVMKPWARSRLLKRPAQLERHTACRSGKGKLRRAQITVRQVSLVKDIAHGERQLEPG